MDAGRSGGSPLNSSSGSRSSASSSSPLNSGASKKTRVHIGREESDSGYSMTNSQELLEANLDTEAGPDIADANSFSEEFRPASEVFTGNDLDFLGQHGSQSSSVSHLARQSLYTKFDPLIGGRPSVYGRPSVAPFANRKNKEDLMEIDSPAKTTSTTTLNSVGDVNETVGNDTTNMNNNNNDCTALDPEELSAREKNYKHVLLQKDQKSIELEKELEDLKRKAEKLKKDLERSRESEEQMKQVVLQYEETISNLITNNKDAKGKLEEEIHKLQEEKDQAVIDLNNVETAFADVHRKYERTKQVVDGFKSNEDQLKKHVEDYKAKLSKSEQRYEILKQHAEDKLEEANKEIDSVSKQQDAEIAKLTAKLRKSDMLASSLERDLDRKKKENTELTNICDDLINKVGT
jgi:hypothetical protein